MNKEMILGLTEVSSQNTIKEKAFELIADIRWVAFSKVEKDGKTPVNRIFT